MSSNERLSHSIPLDVVRSRKVLPLAVGRPGSPETNTRDVALDLSPRHNARVQPPADPSRGTNAHGQLGGLFGERVGADGFLHGDQQGPGSRRFTPVVQEVDPLRVVIQEFVQLLEMGGDSSGESRAVGGELEMQCMNDRLEDSFDLTHPVLILVRPSESVAPVEHVREQVVHRGVIDISGILVIRCTGRKSPCSLMLA